MEEYKYFCEKCQYGTNIKNSIERHNESNYHKTGIKTRKEKENKVSYECKECKENKYITDNKSNYVLHKLNNHSTKEERKKEFKYYCELCDFGVFAETIFNIHKESKVHKKILEISKQIKS